MATGEAGAIDVVGDQTIGGLIRSRAILRGSETLLCYEPPDGGLVELSWDGVVERMEDLRRRLAALEIGQGDVAILCLPNSPAFHLFWFAVSENGAAMLPVDPSSGPVALRRLIETTEASCVVTLPEGAGRAREALEGNDGCRVLVVEDLTLERPAMAVDGWHPGDAAAPSSPRSNRSTAALLQTSGSTGVPKLVELTHANYVYSGESFARNFGLRRDDRGFICLPLYHSGAQLFSTMASLVTGTSIGYVSQFSASRFMTSVVRTEATWASLFGAPMRMILKRWHDAGGGRIDTGKLRKVFYAQSLTAAEWDDWEAAFGALETAHAYGQTEAVALRIGHAPWSDWTPDVVGAPLVETEVRLVGEDGRDVGYDEPGEVWIRGERGATLMKGYYGQPELTERTIVDGWLHTGDVMRRRADGAMHFVARASHIIKRAGENISLPELEALMVDCPLAADVAVSGEPDPFLEQKLVVFVIPAEGYSRDAFVDWCIDRLGRNGKPDEVVEMKAFPRTGVGKVQTAQLRALSREESGNDG